jgi:hypothetical protein
MAIQLRRPWELNATALVLAGEHALMKVGASSEWLTADAPGGEN